MGADYPELYPRSLEDAGQLGELERWRESHKRNVACALAIEEAIRQGFDGMHADSPHSKPKKRQKGLQWRKKFAIIPHRNMEKGVDKRADLCYP